jgi:hypothetical protein
MVHTASGKQLEAFSIPFNKALAPPVPAQSANNH